MYVRLYISFEIKKINILHNILSYCKILSNQINVKGVTILINKNALKLLIIFFHILIEFFFLFNTSIFIFIECLKLRIMHWNVMNEYEYTRQK
jgi:hypothetical protein